MGNTDASGPRSRRPPPVAAAVAQFAVTGMLTLALLAFAAIALLRHTGREEAIRDAKQFTQLAGDGIVAPAVRPGLVRGDPRAVAAVDRAVRGAVLRGPVVRVKIWDASGRIVYSDEPRLIGQRYSLGADDREAVATGSTDAEVSDLSRPENRFERQHGKLLEVYLGIHPRGRRRSCSRPISGSARYRRADSACGSASCPR